MSYRGKRKYEVIPPAHTIPGIIEEAANSKKSSFQGCNTRPMTNWNIYLSYFFLFLLLSACSENPLKAVKGDSDLNFKESLEKWDELKRTQGNSYFYLVSTSSVFGFGSETRIKVADGIVMERSYEAFTLNNLGTREISESYVENFSELNTNATGASPQTLDQVYENCKKHLKEDTKKHTLYFDTFDNGIISLCGYVPEGCQDDCFTGIRISEFGWL